MPKTTTTTVAASNAEVSKKKARKTPSKFMRTSVAATPRTPASSESKRQTTGLTSTPATPATGTTAERDGSPTAGRLGPDVPAKKYKAPVLSLPNGQTINLVVVDMSNQALTNVPESLFENHAVGVLDLSANNISQIGASIVQLPYLHELHVNNTSIRCRGPQDNEGLSRNLAKLTYLHTLSIQCCNLIHVPPIIWELRNLTELYLNRNRIYNLPAEVGKLKKLKKLNLQLTGLTTLPPEIAYCQDLQELILFGNALQSLPETVAELTQLHTLGISYRVFTSANVDGYMENLIQKQQIQSEHIPSVVYNLRNLREMDLSFTKINTFPQHNLDSLSSLDLSNNYIRTFPDSVCRLLRLRELNLSNNELKRLPDALSELSSTLRRLNIGSNKFEAIPMTVFELTNLRDLDCSHNSITEIPPEITNLQKLRTLNMASNELTVMPEYLAELNLLETLDVRKNHIAEVPATIHKLDSLNLMHSFDGLKRTGLWLLGNPELAVPPPVVWMGDDMGLLCDSVRRLAVQNLAKDSRLNPTRLLLLGDNDRLKTAVVKQLLGIHYMEGSSKICSIHRWSSSNGVPFVVYDLHTSFEAANALMPLFLVKSSLILLLFDFNSLNETEPTEASCLERWLDAVSVCAPSAVVKLVAVNNSEAHFDEEDSPLPQNLNVTAPLCNQRTKIEVMKYMKRISGAISRHQQDISRVVLKPNLPALKRIHDVTAKRLELLSDLKASETLLRTCREVTYLDSWKNADRWEELEWQLELLATNEALTPHVQVRADKSWEDFGRRLLQKRNPMIDWQQVLQEASVAGCPTDECLKVLEYLEACGVVGRHLPGKWVHVRPQQLMKAIEPLLLSTGQPIADELVLKHRARFPLEKFEKALQSFKSDGSICEPLLKCSIFYPTAGHLTSMKQTEKLLEDFALGYIRNDTESQGKCHQQSWFTTSIVKMTRQGKENDDDIEPQRNLSAGCWPEAFEGGAVVEKVQLWPVVAFEAEMRKLFQLFQVRLHQAAWQYMELEPAGHGVAAEIRRNGDSEFTQAFVVVELKKWSNYCYFVEITTRGQDELYVSWALDTVANVINEFYLLYPGVLLSGSNYNN